MENPNEISKRVLTIKKTFNVPRKTVWEAWTRPEHIAQWWAPKGMKVTVIRHEFKVGGQWKYSIPMPDGSEFISEGVYSEIIVPEKIVTSADFKPILLSASFTQRKRIAWSRKKWAFTMDGVPRSTGWKKYWAAQ